VRGVVLMDALYGEVDNFGPGLQKTGQHFRERLYRIHTRKKCLAEIHSCPQKIAYQTDLKEQKWQHGVTFLSTKSNVGHWNFVTHAWADYPLKDLLSRLDEYRR